MSEPLIPKHGGYRNLKSFQVAQLAYDLTKRFCDRYVDKRSRTHDQMVQAARSGVQNIAEGSMAAATSKKMELKLTGVARASLEELQLDFEDYLRQRDLELWRSGDPRRTALVALRPRTAADVERWVAEVDLDGRSGQRGPGETEANAILTLVVVASSLLQRQLIALAHAFEKEGGFTERLYRVRSDRRSRP